MAENTKIEWAHHTLNLWEGCMKVHDGCDNCYAETRDKIWHGGKHWGAHAPRKIVLNSWGKLNRFQRLAQESGEVHRVFVGSLMDIFEKPMPLVDAKGSFVLNEDRSNMMTNDLRDKLFANISAGMYPNLLFLLLTKRPGNILKYIPKSWVENPPANVMYGTSPVDQETADDMIPKLLQVPGKHFLSCEPLLGNINFRWREYAHKATGETYREYLERNGSVDEYESLKGIDWVIVGGESGHNARPMHPDWVRSLRDQCEAAGVPFFFKQYGEWASGYQNMLTGEMVFRQFKDFQQWVDKASTWVCGGICLDRDGKQLNIGKDFMEARDNGRFPVTIMHRVGKKAAGRLLDGKEYSQFPEFYKME